MNLARLMEHATLVKEVLEEVRASSDYIVGAVEHGKMDPKLHAVCIAEAENWEYLSHHFQDLQSRVDAQAQVVAEMVFPMKGEEGALVSIDAMRVLEEVGLTVFIDVELGSPGYPLRVFGVFEVIPNLKFAI